MNRSLLALFLALSAAHLSHAQALLFDQTSGVTTSGLIAQDFEALYAGYDCRIADDFEVPTGETWWIDSIRIYGFYGPGGGPFDEIAGLNIQVYSDNNGSPGTQLFTDLITANLDPDGNGSITGYWSTPIQLTAGTYWLAAAARKDYANNGGLWYWLLDSVGSGNEGLWENQSGGWATGCTNWTNFTGSCLALDYMDAVFRIYGCYGATKPGISDLGNDTAFCAGPTLTLTANSSASGIAYLWNTGATTSTIVVDTAGYYKVIAYDTVTLCGSYSDIYVDIQPTPQSNIANDTICPGKSKTFNGFACPSCQYEWSDGSTNIFYSTTTEGWVVLTITDPGSGCVGIDSAWLEVDDLDPPTFVPGPEVDLCVGDTVTISTTQSYNTYVWNSDNFSAPQFVPSITVYEGGKYFVTVTTPNACSMSDSVIVELRPLPEPEITVSYTASWKTRLNAPPGYQSYLWSNGDDDVSTIANKTGSYSVTVTDEFGCVGSATLYVITGLNEISGGGWLVYPNPAEENFYIKCPGQGLVQARFLITDLGGRVLQPAMNVQCGQSVDVSALPGGYYLLHLHTPDEKSILPIAVE